MATQWTLTRMRSEGTAGSGSPFWIERTPFSPCTMAVRVRGREAASLPDMEGSKFSSVKSAVIETSSVVMAVDAERSKAEFLVELQPRIMIIDVDCDKIAFEHNLRI